MRVLFALILCLAGLPRVVAAQDSDLAILDTLDQAKAWQAVGRIDVRGKGFCTGTLISPDLVLTAAHCVLDGETPVDTGAVSFAAGLRFGRSHAQRAARRLIILPGGSGEEIDKGRDLALIEVSRPIRRAGFAAAEIGAAMAPGMSVSVVSYGMGRAEAPARQSQCQVLAEQGAVSVLSCEGTFGTSGAPVFMQSAGEARVTGVILAVGTLDDQPVTIAHRLGAPLQELLSLERSGGGQWRHGAQGPFTGIRPGERRDTGAKSIRVTRP